MTARAGEFQVHRGPTVAVRVPTGRAIARGVSEVVMDVLAENRRVLALIARRWPDASYDRCAESVTVHAGLRRGATPVSTASHDHRKAGVVTKAAKQPSIRQGAYQWEDPAISAAAARELDGMTFFQAMKAGTIPPPPPIIATLDFGWVSVEPGKVVFEITPAEFHYNPIGSVHGGVYATLCDSACGCAVHSMLPAGTCYTSLDLNVKFVRPITADCGRLLCEGMVQHIGTRMALAEARLADQAGKLYAHATSSCLIFRS